MKQKSRKASPASASSFPRKRESSVVKPTTQKMLAPRMRAGDDVDAYIASFAEPIRARLEKVRAAIRKAAPQAEEGISYRIPAYKLRGTLIYFAGFPRHIGLYPAPRSAPEFSDELSAYKGGKGTVQFPHDAPLPLALIRRIVKYRAAENSASKQTRRPKTTRRAGS